MRLPFTDTVTQRRLQCLVADAHPRGPEVIVQLLVNVASRIGGGPAILGALEELAASDRPRRRLGETRHVGR